MATLGKYSLRQHAALKTRAIDRSRSRERVEQTWQEPERSGYECMLALLRRINGDRVIYSDKLTKEDDDGDLVIRQSCVASGFRIRLKSGLRLRGEWLSVSTERERGK